MPIPDVLLQSLASRLIPRKRRSVWNEQPDYGFDYNDAAGPGPDEDQEPAKPAIDFLPSIFKPRSPESQAAPAAPQFEVDRHGRPKPPKTYSDDPSEAIAQKVAYVRALRDYQPTSHNSRLKSALLTAGRGALQGFAAGGPGGALFGAAAGGIQGAVSPATDERYSKQQAIGRAQKDLGWEQQQRQIDTDYDTAVASNRLKSEQAANLASLPEREKDRQWAAMRKDLVDTYNRLPTFDPKTNPQFAAALESFGIPVVAKDRAKRTQVVINQKTGAVEVVSADPNTGMATAAPVMQGEKPFVTTTAPQMAQERQVSSQKFQQEQQGRTQQFQQAQQGRSQSYGELKFNEKKEQARQAKQQALVGNLDGVKASIGRLNWQISQLEKTNPEPKSPDGQQLVAMRRNLQAVRQRGELLAGQLNSLGDYEAGVGSEGTPYYKLRPGKQQGTTQTGPGKYTEAEVRARARRAGRDENVAVQKARDAGLIP